MLTQIKKAIVVILSVVLLVSLTACQTPAIQETPPPVSTTDVTSPGPSAEPATPKLPEIQESGDAGKADQDPDPDKAPEEDTPSPTESGEVERIIIRLGENEVLKGTILDPLVTILPVSAADKSYTISSGDESIIRQVYGFWTAVGGGSAELIAAAANGVTGAVTVTVIVPLEAVSLSASMITLNRGDSVTLTPIFTPGDTTDTHVDYTSDDENVASVSEDGMVHAAGAGTTEIQCTVGGITASCTVTVVVPVTGISMNTDKRIYKVGDKGGFTVQISPQDATDKTFSTEVNNTSAALTGTNTFSCNSSGEATITVTAANGMTASQTITVIDLAAYAGEVFRLTNIERANAGLEPLSMMSNLTQTAVVRANEIIQHFAHDRPDGSDCFTAFDDNGVSYSMAGENIAMGQRSPSEVVRAWMESPGHRENIMNGDFGHLGVGVAMDSNGRLYWAQNFTD